MVLTSTVVGAPPFAHLQPVAIAVGPRSNVEVRTMTAIARLVGRGVATQSLELRRTRPRHVARWGCCRGVVLSGSVGSVPPLDGTVSILDGGGTRGMCTPWVTAPRRGLTWSDTADEAHPRRWPGSWLRSPPLCGSS